MDCNGVEVTCRGWEMEPGGGNLIFGFQFDDRESKTLVTPDEAKFFDTDQLPSDLDLWIRECGLFRTDPGGNPVFGDDLWERKRNWRLRSRRRSNRYTTFVRREPCSPR